MVQTLDNSTFIWHWERTHMFLHNVERMMKTTNDEHIRTLRWSYTVRTKFYFIPFISFGEASVKCNKTCICCQDQKPDWIFQIPFAMSTCAVGGRYALNCILIRLIVLEKLLWTWKKKQVLGLRITNPKNFFNLFIVNTCCVFRGRYETNCVLIGSGGINVKLDKQRVLGVKIQNTIEIFKFISYCTSIKGTTVRNSYKWVSQWCLAFIDIDCPNHTASCLLMFLS